MVNRRSGLILLASLVLVPSGPASAQGFGDTLRNLWPFGGNAAPGQTVPPAPDDVVCPRVGVIEGGSALRQGSGATIRHQISISDLARECTERTDGSTVVKVGVELRALLGTGGGGSARSEVPVRFVVKRGDQVFASRVRRVTVSIPSGDTQGTATVVEDGLVVPPGVTDWEVQVGLGAAERRPQRR